MTISAEHHLKIHLHLASNVMSTNQTKRVNKRKITAIIPRIKILLLQKRRIKIFLPETYMY